MKRAIYTGGPKLELLEVETPRPGAGEVLIKVDSATICGTDVHILDGNQPAKPGTCLGHEFSGYVEAVGAGVFACKPGDLVTVEPHIYCGVCKPCRTGSAHLCHDKQAFGVNRHGGFEQYALVPQHTAYVVPEGVTPEAAALCEPIGCCLHGIDRVGVGVGDTVLIFGGGMIGILMLKLCRLRGAAQVIVSEPVALRREFLISQGADAVVDPAAQDVRERVMALTGGLGADVVIECAGRGETVRLSTELAGRCGRILLFGIVPPGENVAIEPNDIFRRELSIFGSAINPNTHHRVLSVLRRLDVEGLVSARYPLSRINEAVDEVRGSRGLKVCIKPNL